VYNDGYLGSESDLGTFTNREKEISFLDGLANRSLYGGEVVSESGVVGEYNSVDYITVEAFKTQ
jgi:hypothetical protein